MSELEDIWHRTPEQRFDDERERHAEHIEELAKKLQRAEAALAAEKERAEKAENDVGWLYHNPDTGVEFDTEHPVRSGKVNDATNIRRATADELLSELKLAWEIIEEERSAEAKQGSKWIEACSDRDAAIARAEAAEAPLREALALLKDFVEFAYSLPLTCKSDGEKFNDLYDRYLNLSDARAVLAETE